jgi:hypothetical protein
MTMVFVFAGAAILEMIAHCAHARTSAPEEEHATRGLAHVLVIIDSRGQIVQL